MLDAMEINAEIARLEYIESSYPNYAKLADLYIIRDRMQGSSEPLAYEQSYPTASAVAVDISGDYGDSNFLQSVSGKSQQKVMEIMDELMDTLKVVNPRTYDSVMRKIDAL